MSELVEKVEYAIDYQIQNHGFGPHVSRAAIAAVAEWLENRPLGWPPNSGGKSAAALRAAAAGSALEAKP